VGDLVADLRACSEECIETHISWVFLRPNEVFKLKKPVDFGFLDFTDAARRLAACEAEVELNSRLAPGVYRGVLPVRRDGAGVHHVAASGDGEIVDHVVHMDRLPIDARADLRLERGALGGSDIVRLAQRLARFHEAAARSREIAQFGSIGSIRRNVEENFVQARSLLQKLAGEALEREVEERQLGFLRSNAERFAQRVERGFIRDGHGDLRLEHVYLLPDRDPVIIDCIEFNERFRYADVCADIAFLSMDLGWHGRPDLKERLLAAYARETDDYELYALVDFYESYRAYVRAKVQAFSLASPSLQYAARARAEADARRYLLVALAAERPALGEPRLIAVGGLIASGKSSVADALGERLAVPVISSDETRKRLLGVAPLTPLHDQPWHSAYSPEVSERVYSALLERARVVLESGRSVVLDATFGQRSRREAARQLARTSGAAFAFVECRASEPVARARLEARARGPSVSDGRSEIYAELARRHEPATELPPPEHVPLDTSGTLASSLAQLERAGLVPGA
jgi:hypothetical protein